MPEVDLYLRKSKITRQRERALTFRAQEERGRRWADENGYRVRKVWKDNLSAYSDVKRPEFAKALAALADGEVPALWNYALDRFSRKGAGAVLPLLDAGRRLIFDYERLDSSDDRDRGHIIREAENAREFSRKLSTRVLDTKEQQREEGAWLGRAPYGLRIADALTRKLKHSAQWKYVLRVFREAADGRSLRAIARGLNADSVPSPRGGEWSASSVHAILISPTYEGYQVLVVGRRVMAFRNRAGARVPVFADGVKPVPAELIQRARQTISGHKPVSTPGRAKNLLAGILRCAGCGGRMMSQGTSYACSSHSTGKHCAAPASARRPALEAHVLRKWRAAVLSVDLDDPSPLMITVAERWQALRRPEETAEVGEARAAVKAAEAAIAQLADDRAAGLYAGAMGKHFPRLVAEAEATLAEAEARVAEMAPPAVDLTMFDDHDVFDAFWESADGALRRDVIRLAIDCVTVVKGPRGTHFRGDERVSIQWAESAA